MDIANIYNLPEEKLAQYRDNPFPDNEIRPGTIEFAKKFKNEIITLPTPYVIALEGGYGVGKTYFITRFCEYLKKSNFEEDKQIQAIYLNLWENDYVSDPFPIIVARIIQELDPAQDLKQSITDGAIKITKNLVKFGAKMLGGIDIDLPDLKQEKEDIKTFKSNLQNLINEKGEKVVLIVDELDRCKPDYGVKALETIKHFFDIDGLFVILTTRIDFMNCICEAHYGHPKCETGIGEGYIQKFVQSKKILNPTSKKDYLFIISTILNKNSLPVKQSKNQGFSNIGGQANEQAINYFIKVMADIFDNAKLSIRKTIDICNEILTLILRKKENIWEDKINGFPEFIITKYLKAKNLIPDSIIDPTVSWRFPDDSTDMSTWVQETIDNLL